MLVPERNKLQRGIARVLTLKPVRAYLHYSESNGGMLADAVTYRMLFGVFAGVVVGFSIASLWLSGNQEAMNRLIDAIDEVVPGLIGEDAPIKPDALTFSPGLSIAGIASLLGLFWAALGAIKQLRLAIREIAGTAQDRAPFFIVILRDLAIALIIAGGLGVAGAATFLGTAGVQWLLELVGWDGNGGLVNVATRSVVIVVVFLLDALLVAAMFRLLSGLRPPAKALIPGALIGGLGLSVLQQLSGLFVGGASSNPLLASFASLIALLLWFNLSVQVVLIASAYIATGIEDDDNRLRAKFGAASFAQRRVRRAERKVSIAAEELQSARDAEAEERDKLLVAQDERAAKADGDG